LGPGSSLNILKRGSKKIEKGDQNLPSGKGSVLSPPSPQTNARQRKKKRGGGPRASVVVSPKKPRSQGAMGWKRGYGFCVISVGKEQDERSNNNKDRKGSRGKRGNSSAETRERAPALIVIQPKKEKENTGNTRAPPVGEKKSGPAN